eukprot:TRINITY_DN410_c0_g1_i2.p1 TRINITY_DN410_c0_g1~~TRINITY_DN410_c0_g1_i2.p1  ORF type:complete len:226 (-),score=23.07 TRINITY_DN410_c0_g1_i2:322-999(-)
MSTVLMKLPLSSLLSSTSTLSLLPCCCADKFLLLCTPTSILTWVRMFGTASPMRTVALSRMTYVLTPPPRYRPTHHPLYWRCFVLFCLHVLHTLVLLPSSYPSIHSSLQLTCCGFDQTVTPALRDQLQCPDDATQNCETVLEDRLKKYRKIIITVVVMTGLLQVLSLIASAWLIRSITQAKRRGTAHHDFLHDAGAYQNFQDERPAVPATQHQPQQQGGLYPNMR